MHRMARRSLLALLGLAAPALAATGGGGDDNGSLAGRLLVAGEALDDPNFARTVLLMVSHAGDGALGLVVNRPYGTAPLAALVKRLGVGNVAGDRAVAVGYGGPVSSETGFLIVDGGRSLAGAFPVTDRLTVSPDPKALLGLAGADAPVRALVTLGYAGWGPGQLEGEIARGDWAGIVADPDLVLAADPLRTWDAARARIGTDL